MKHLIIAFLLMLFFNPKFCISQELKKNKIQKIIIEVSIPSQYYKLPLSDSIELEAVNFDYVDIQAPWNIYKKRIVNQTLKWVLYADKPMIIRSSILSRGSRLVSPGDSIFITFNENGKNYSGKGIDKFILQDKIEEINRKKFLKPTKFYVTLNSCEDYFKWKNYLDQRLVLIMSLFDENKSKFSPVEFDLMKTLAIRSIEHERGESFMAIWKIVNLEGYANANVGPLYTNTDLIAICDSTLNNNWAKWIRSKSDFYGDPWYILQYERIQVLKRFGFSLLQDSINTASKREVQNYNSLKQNYKGLLRERLLQFLLAEIVIKNLGYNHVVTQALLKDYYSLPGFPEYKNWMKVYEVKASKLYKRNSGEDNSKAPDFQLIDKNGKLFVKNDLKGKIAILDFWFSGCKGCVNMVPQLTKVENVFKNDSNIVFLNISTDTDKKRWLKSVDQRKYTTGEGVNLFTGGQGANHPMLKAYNISSYPELYLINTEGDVVFPVPDPRRDNGVALISLINKMRAELNDGPYVLFNDDTACVSYINMTDGVLKATTKRMKINEAQKLQVLTDQFPETFTVQLKSELKKEPSTFDQPEKQLVLSDIEGNFDAFRKLLQLNGVIDKQYNWTFGNGHLMFVGDLFDRGTQVTECLWLIYSLEEKAKAAGGYVHFILGNHEVLNLSNDQRYVREKYKQNAKLLNENYKNLYGEKSELGRWLRTKNIIEKIGNVLYLHGGVSKEVNGVSMSLQEINELTRPHYASRDEFKTNIKEPVLMILFNSKVSPFWYRGYYKKGKDAATASQVDSTLKKFSVNRIVTGHTIVADTISLHFDGKVINVDTKHAEGKSEALLIEGNNYYRVNTEGKKEPLIVEFEKQFVQK